MKFIRPTYLIKDGDKFGEQILLQKVHFVFEQIVDLDFTKTMV